MEKYAGGKRLVHPDRFLIFSHRVELPYFHGKWVCTLPTLEQTLWSNHLEWAETWHSSLGFSEHCLSCNLINKDTRIREKWWKSNSVCLCESFFFHVSGFWLCSGLNTYLVFLMLIITGLLFLSDSLLLCPICLDSTYFSDSFFNFYLPNLPQVSAQSSFPIKTQYKQSILDFKRLHCLNICLLLNPPSLSMCAIG